MRGLDRRWCGDSRRQCRIFRDSAGRLRGLRARRILGRAGDTASRWDSAAAELPELVMSAFDLDTPVDLGTGPADVTPWDDAGVVHLLAAI